MVCGCGRGCEKKSLESRENRELRRDAFLGEINLPELGRNDNVKEEKRRAENVTHLFLFRFEMKFFNRPSIHLSLGNSRSNIRNE